MGFRYLRAEVTFFLEKDLWLVLFSTVSAILLVFQPLIFFTQVLDLTPDVVHLGFLPLSVFFGVVFVSLF